MNLTLGVKLIGEYGEAFCGILSRPLVASSHPSNETYSLYKEELGNKSSSPRPSVISIPELLLMHFTLDRKSVV